MTHGDDPRSLGTILWLVRFLPGNTQHCTETFTNQALEHGLKTMNTGVYPVLFGVNGVFVHRQGYVYTFSISLSFGYKKV